MAAMVERAKIRASRLQRSQIAGDSRLLNGVQSVNDISLDTTEETWGPLLEKLKIFADIADTVAEVGFTLITDQSAAADSCLLD